MMPLAVSKAVHVGEHRLQLTFSDATSQAIDFGPFLLTHPHPQHNKYRDWDLILPVAQLHQGYVGLEVY